MNQITPEQALQVLDIITNPANAGKISRVDYGNAQVALETLSKFVQEHSPKSASVPPNTPAPVAAAPADKVPVTG